MRTFIARCRALLALCPVVAGLTLATTAAAAQEARELPWKREALVQLVERESGLRQRIEVRVGEPPFPQQLAPCQRTEPFVPAGTRLWGRTQVGVRCIEGARWTILVPVTVAVFGPALVAGNTVAVNTPLHAQDFRLEEIDLTRESGTPVSDLAQIEGRVSTRPIQPGQILRADQLRIPPSVLAGEAVRIVLTGPGFSLTSEGVALSPGIEGQPLRVRTEGGRVLSGLVRDRTVEIRL